MTDHHTPGPWHVEGDHVVKTDHLAKALIAYPVEGPYALPYDERRANAHLISASPDMLAALEAYVAEHDKAWIGRQVYSKGEMVEGEPCRCGKCTTARLAIAKARGETVARA